jgi:hypothetical protein
MTPPSFLFTRQLGNGYFNVYFERGGGDLQVRLQAISVWCYASSMKATQATSHDSDTTNNATNCPAAATNFFSPSFCLFKVSNHWIPHTCLRWRVWWVTTDGSIPVGLSNNCLSSRRRPSVCIRVTHPPRAECLPTTASATHRAKFEIDQ